MGCKRFRKLRIKRLRIFTKAVPQTGRKKGSDRLLRAAKKEVLKTIDKLEKRVWDDKISSFERAWFEASGENRLMFNFADMRENVINAKFGLKDLEPNEDFGHNDGLQVILNKNTPMNQVELEKLLLHESMHHNVTRARQGNPALNDDIDHLALALLGDPDEKANFDLGWFDCPFRNCQNPNCIAIDWVE